MSRGPVIHHQAAFRKARRRRAPLRFTGGEERDMEHVLNDTNCVKVAPYLRQKVEAIAAHRSQFPIQPDLLPLAILQALMGQEYFVSVSLVSEGEPEFLAVQGRHERIRLLC